MVDAPDEGGDAFEVCVVSGSTEFRGNTDVPDGAVDREDGGTDVRVDDDNDDFVVAEGCDGVSAEWSPTPPIVGLGLVPSVVTFQRGLPQDHT